MILNWTPASPYVVTGDPDPMWLGPEGEAETELSVDVHELITTDVVTG
jgi:hypothetical protein